MVSEPFRAMHMRRSGAADNPMLFDYVSLVEYQRKSQVVTPMAGNIISWTSGFQTDLCLLVNPPSVLHPDLVSIFVDDVCVYRAGTGSSPFALAGTLGLRSTLPLLFDPNKGFYVGAVLGTDRWAIRQDTANDLQRTIMKCLTGLDALVWSIPSVPGSPKFYWEEVGRPFNHYVTQATELPAYSSTSISLPPKRFRFEVPSWAVAGGAALMPYDKLVLPCVAERQFVPYI
jgi:hypothetical protein